MVAKNKTDQLITKLKPPLRFIAGVDAVGTAEQVSATLQQQTNAYRELSGSLVFDDV